VQRQVTGHRECFARAGDAAALEGEGWVLLDVEGLYYLRARYYDRALGRFLSRDPSLGDEREPLSLQRYQYASNNPTNRVDPTGRFDVEFGGFFDTAEVNPSGFFNLGHPFGDDPKADAATGFPRLVLHLKAARAIAATAIDLALVRLEGIDDYESLSSGSI
jgi:RHS repeat-associated protein